MQPQSAGPQQHMQTPHSATIPMHSGMHDQSDPQGWAQHMDMMAQHQHAAGGEDTWSNSSNGRHNPIVPTTLNVEDWYVFLQSNSTNDPTDLINLYHHQQAAFNGG
jgi:hypothetical protein